MNSDSPQSPREELEARLTAFLLGELTAEETASLRQSITQDAELARLHDRLKQAIGLVRETTASPEQENLAPPDAPKLAPERRAALLNAFKVVRPKELRKASRPTFARRELVAVAAMVVVLCLAGAFIVAPNFEPARSAAQRQYLYVARDESGAEAAASATPSARGENGRVSVSGKPADVTATVGQSFFYDGQPQNEATLSLTLPTGGALPVARLASPSVRLGMDQPPRGSISGLKPEVNSFSVVADALAPSLPLLPPPPPSEPSQPGERAARQFASIALPALEGEEVSTGSQLKNDGQSLIDLNRSLSAGGTFTADSRSLAGRGGGGLGSVANYSQFAGESFVGAAGATDNPTPATLASSLKPADGPALLAYGVAPVPSFVSPKADQDFKREPSSLALAQDDGVQFKAGGVNLGGLLTNTVFPRAMLSVEDPTRRDAGQFGGVAAGRAGQVANVPQQTEGILAATLPEALGLLGDQSGNRVRVLNGAADGFYRFHSPDPRVAEAKGSMEAEKKLAELSKAERLDSPARTTALLFDAERKDIVRDLQRESGLKSDEKSQVAKQFADGDAAINKRFEIALPESERDEAKEKLRVATGPVVMNEPMPTEPATGLPAKRPSDVSLVPLQVARKPIAPATKAPVPQVATVENLVEAGSNRTNGLVGEPALEGSAEVVTLSRQLDNLRSLREKVATRIWQEKTDTSIPKSGNVEVIDAAEEQPSEKPTLWARIRGVVGGDVERTTRITVQKDAPDIRGIGGQSYNAFDPYWVQTESEKIQSKAVLEKVIEQLNLNEAWGKSHGGSDKLQTEETYRLLKKKIDVRSDPKTGLVDIRVKSDSPDEAARIANTIAQVYLEARTEKSRQKSARGAEALSEELVRQDREIARVEQELERRKNELSPEQADVSLPKLAASAPIPQPEVSTVENFFSTFSLNVSDVSFKLAAAALEKGQMPDPATVRSEEFINAFDYRDPEPKGSAPIAFASERVRYPFAHDRDLLRFSVKTAASGRQPGRPLNLVLLLDNSGSMERADRVRIRQECLRVLANQLQPQDRVSVVAFARTARLWVDGLPGSHAGELPQRVGSLTPEGGTNLEDAMNLAYQTALRHFLANGVNRVVLLTDGAANLGDVEPESLKKKVEANRKQGVALDCFGIGWDGLNDELLEALSRNGDGRYGFVNTPEAATTEFASQLAGALKVAASDVKVQVEWNPRRVTAYRQIGYAKHQLKKEQFRDNTVDAAEIGAAEAGNALYTVQVNPRGEGPLATVRVRFKIPGTGDYREHEWTVPYEGAAKSLDSSSPALRLAASASAFSEWLVSSPFAAEVTPDKLLAQMNGVPETWPADPRPKKLEWMIRQAKSVAGK